MRISADITGQTLYVQRLTSNGSIQLTKDKSKAMALERYELPEAIARLTEQYSPKNIQSF